MSVAAERALILAVLDAVDDVGETHDYKRWSVKWSDFLDQFKATVDSVDQIRGWELTWLGYSGATQESMRRDERGIERLSNWRIDGYMSVDDADASAKTFDDLVEDVVDALDASTTINARAVCLWRTPANALVDFRLFGSVLVHHAEITLSLQVRNP